MNAVREDHSHRPDYASDKDLSIHFGVSRPTIWRWVRNSDFPKPYRIGPAVTRWRMEDVRQWEQSREVAV